ncbi:MAG: hypothetical protein ACTSV9_04560 [Candidatus Thorarchaeota archaeon]
MLGCLGLYLAARYHTKRTTPVTWNLHSRPIDTSIAHRVIRDMATKEEAVIDGDYAISFRKALQDEEIWYSVKSVEIPSGLSLMIAGTTSATSP